jgi:glyoxylase-like metal-dependent hydrolase (beta-lactamase superfamily II)
VYLLEGSDSSIVISGGTSYILPDVLAQIKDFQLDETKIRGLLILHAHFDHIGIVPALHRRYPEMTLYASKRAWEILAEPRSIETINSFSRIITEQMGVTKKMGAYNANWTLGITGTTVHEGDVISLGNRDIRILETPGHSSCSISAYVPQLKALFASDGGGIPYRDTIVIAANSNYTEYQKSLVKLAQLDVDYVCADHFGYVHGAEARDHVQRTIEVAQSEREKMEEIYKRTGDVDRATKEFSDEFYANNPDYFLPREIWDGVRRQMMRHIAQCLKA